MKDLRCGKKIRKSFSRTDEILEMPKKGFLGIGAAPAKVRVYIEYTKAGRAVEYLQEVLRAMGFSGVEIDVKEE